MKQPLLIIAALLLAACQPKPPPLPKNIPAWKIGAVSSSLYPAGVSRAYGINETYNWTSLVHNFLGTGSSYDRIHPHKPHYQGYALPLGVPVQMRYQIQPAKILPDIMVVKWGSLATNRRFTTRLDLTDALKKRMNTPRQNVLDQYSSPFTCYQRTMVFGLLPDGRARIWLSGCGYFSYITTLKPYRETPPPTAYLPKTANCPLGCNAPKPNLGSPNSSPSLGTNSTALTLGNCNKRTNLNSPTIKACPWMAV